jgi:hypothetical protein
MMAVQIGGLALDKRKQFMSISPGITYETDKDDQVFPKPQRKANMSRERVVTEGSSGDEPFSDVMRTMWYGFFRRP